MAYGTRRLIKDLEMVMSPSRVNRPTDNARQERWYRTVKQEEIYCYPTYPSLDIARQSIARYIEEYNQRRPHQALWNYTPGYVHRLGNKTKLLQYHRKMVQIAKKQRIKEKPNIIAFAGDGATADIGLQSLSGALERGHNFLYVCLDNEAYMNTGIQRSSSTPYGAMTTTSPPGKKSIGQCTWKKNVAMIAAAHNIPYVATASPGYHLDLMNKVRKALAVDGPAYIQIFSPCPTGWRSKPEQSITLAKLAVQTGVFPLFEVEYGRFKITQKTKELKPVKEYLQLQRRFRHLGEDDIAYIQERVKAEFERLKALASLDA
jgi:pyruvate/2-oxoacid:ferredoxin oxidoreductase beta subunit